MENLDIVYQDDHLVAVNKPAGLLVHRSEIDRRETRFAVQILRGQLGRRVYPVHRLDKPTSGLLLFALDPETAGIAGRAFARGEVAKTYLAVVRGVPDAEGIIDHPLQDEPQRRAPGETFPLKPARTSYRPLASVELPFAVGRYPTSRYALVEARPLTGRRRQIRRHFKHVFHPIIGDTTYGEGRHNRFFREEFGCGRLLLASVGLTLPHPANGRPLSLRAPLDPSFLSLIDRFDWRGAISTSTPEGG